MRMLTQISHIVLLSLIWGPVFLFIKLGLEDFDPFTLTFFRLFFAFLMAFFLTILFIKNPLEEIKQTYKKHKKVIFISTVLTNALPFTLCSVGEYYVDSSLAGIIEGIVPSMTLFFSWALLKKKITIFEIAAIFVGLLGLLIIFIPTLTDTIIGNEFGIIILLFMCLSFTLGFIFCEKKLVDLPNHLPIVSLQLLISSIILFFIMIFFEGAPSFDPFPQKGLINSFLLGAFGTTLGWITFFKTTKRYGASYASLATYLSVGIAIFLGVFFLDEHLSIYSIIGTITIFISMILASLKKKA